MHGYLQSQDVDNGEDYWICCLVVKLIPLVAQYIGRQDGRRTEWQNETEDWMRKSIGKEQRSERRQVGRKISWSEKYSEGRKNLEMTKVSSKRRKCARDLQLIKAVVRFRNRISQYE